MRHILVSMCQSVANRFHRQQTLYGNRNDTQRRRQENSSAGPSFSLGADPAPSLLSPSLPSPFPFFLPFPTPLLPSFPLSSLPFPLEVGPLKSS